MCLRLSTVSHIQTECARMFTHKLCIVHRFAHVQFSIYLYIKCCIYLFSMRWDVCGFNRMCWEPCLSTSRSRLAVVQDTAMIMRTYIPTVITSQPGCGVRRNNASSFFTSGCRGLLALRWLPDCLESRSEGSCDTLAGARPVIKPLPLSPPFLLSSERIAVNTHMNYEVLAIASDCFETESAAEELFINNVVAGARGCVCIAVYALVGKVYLGKRTCTYVCVLGCGISVSLSFCHTSLSVRYSWCMCLCIWVTGCMNRSVCLCVF